MRLPLFAMLALTAAGHAASLPSLLEIAARSSEREIAALSVVACTETVVETRINPKDKTEERRRQSFDYLVLLDTDDGALAVTESRVEQGRAKAAAKPLLASTGFATMLLILHPFYQDSFEFTDLGYTQDGGRQWKKLGFEFRAGKRSPSILRAGAREYPLAWKGEALLDEITGQVLSIHATLGAQLEEIGLRSLEANVRYAPQAAESAEWLPAEAVVELKTNHQHWRNVHSFAGYKKFGVDTSEKREVKQQ